MTAIIKQNDRIWNHSRSRLLITRPTRVQTCSCTMPSDNVELDCSYYLFGDEKSHITSHRWNEAKRTKGISKGVDGKCIQVILDKAWKSNMLATRAELAYFYQNRFATGTRSPANTLWKRCPPNEKRFKKALMTTLFQGCERWCTICVLAFHSSKPKNEINSLSFRLYWNQEWDSSSME